MFKRRRKILLQNTKARSLLLLLDWQLLKEQISIPPDLTIDVCFHIGNHF